MALIFPPFQRRAEHFLVERNDRINEEVFNIFIKCHFDELKLTQACV